MKTQLMNPPAPTHSVNFALLVKPLFSASKETQLDVRRGARNTALILQRPVMSTALVQTPMHSPARTSLSQLPLQTFSVERASGTLFRAAGGASLEPLPSVTVDLPPGVPRYVNAVTLKRMLKAKRSELLLRRVEGQRWDVVEDSFKIDLTDSSIELRLGNIQILS